MSVTYEVTVPLVVHVRDGHVVKTTIERGFPGFFSEAEDAAGVWNPSGNEWEESTEAEAAATAAWQFTKGLLPKW